MEGEASEEVAHNEVLSVARKIMSKTPKALSFHDRNHESSRATEVRVCTQNKTPGVGPTEMNQRRFSM